MNNLTFSGNMRILQVQTRSNSYGADHIRTRSLDLTGKHTGESPLTSVSSSGSDLVCSDLPAYILVSPGNNCLEMQTRNSKPRSSHKVVCSDLHKTAYPLFDLADSSSYSQLFFSLLDHYRPEDDIDYQNAVHMLTKLSKGLSDLERIQQSISPLMKVS